MIKLTDQEVLELDAILEQAYVTAFESNHLILAELIKAQQDVLYHKMLHEHEDDG